jgi:integrase
MNKENKYTKPYIYKGKKPIKIPKGSTLAKEWAKNDWYINYSFNGKQYRIKDNLNRIKDHKEKLYEAEVLLKSIKNDLENGFDPSNPEDFIAQKLNEQIKLSDAITIYIDELATYTRPKTVGSYKSKLHYFNEAFPNKAVHTFTTDEIQQYIYRKIHSTLPAKLFLNGKSFELKKAIPWTSNTVRSAKGIFRAFFSWCIKNNYYKGENPVSKIEQKRIRSEESAKPRHLPFSKEDITKLMNYLDENDKPTAFFTRIIYSTCMRPSEICKLRLKDIDMENKQIIIPLDITKNTKKTSVDIIDIEPNLFEEFVSLKIDNYPLHYFLTSKSNDNIIGELSIGSNKPYKKLVKALKILQLDNKGYTLYSFKHFSNLQRFNNGWTLAEIMKANRHSSISITEIYLKDLNKVTDISKKEVPKI